MKILQDILAARNGGGLLSGMLDGDRDGSVTDDLFGMAKKFLR